jgi:hypothetical protein
MEFTTLIIPVVAIVFSLSIPIIAIITDYSKRRKIYELHHRERMAAIEKGIELPPLPPELLGKEQDRMARGPRYLLKGLIWSLLGLALLLGLYLNEGKDTAAYALMPVAIGVAYLIYYLAEGRKVEAELRKAETPPSPTVSIQ